MTERAYLYSLEEIKARLQSCALALTQRCCPGGHVHGGEYVAHNPMRSGAHKLGSFSINLKKGIWNDFSLGEGGDMLSLIAGTQCGGDYKKAVPWAKDFLGLTGRAPAPGEAKMIEERQRQADAKLDADAEKRRRAAFAIVLEAKPLDGTDPASLYLKARGIDVTKLAGGIPRALRFHPRVLAFPEDTYHPAMLGIMSLEGLAHGFAACHRTYLEERGGVWGKAAFPSREGKRASSKRILGGYKGASIRLCAGASKKSLKDARPGEWIVIGEGIENTLTGALAAPSLRAVAAGAGANIGNVVFPAHIGGVYVLQDNDTDAKAIERFQRQVEALRARHEVAVVNFDGEYKDANDVLLGKRKESAA